MKFKWLLWFVACCLTIVQTLPVFAEDGDDANWAQTVALTATDGFVRNDPNFLKRYKIPDHDKDVAFIVYEVLQAELPSKAIEERRSRVLTLAPHSSEIWLWLSNLLLRYRRDKEAAKYAYSEHLKLNGAGDKDFESSMNAWSGPSVAISIRRERSNKEVEANAALRENNFLAAARIIEATLKSFSEQEKQTPEYGKAATFVARCYADANQKEQAAHFYEEAIKAYSNVVLYDGMPHYPQSTYQEQFESTVNTLKADLEKVR